MSMQIHRNDIPLSTLPLSQQHAQPQHSTRAREAYSRNAAAAQIIEAEFIDAENHPLTNFVRERQELDSNLEQLQSSTPAEISVEESTRGKLQSKFITSAEPPPRPGTYLNFYA